MRTSRLSGSVLLAGALAAVLTGVLVGAVGSHAAASKRAGTIAFIRLVNGPVFGGRLFVVRADGSGLRRVTPRRTMVYSYAWSPDGRLIAYIDQRFSLWLMRPDGTGRGLLLPTSRLSSVGLSWSPDGKEIAIASAGVNANPRTARCGLLYVVPIDSGQPTPLTRTKGSCDVAWSPRGGEIAYDHGGVFAIRADVTGRRRVSPPGSGGLVQWSADGAQLAFNVVIHLRKAWASPIATTRSASSTLTERTFTSSRPTPTTSTGLPGRRKGGESSTAERIARASA